MPTVTEIPWGDGTNDKIYLSRNASEGNQNVDVSSDANTGAARSKVITFTSGVGNITRQLTVSQEAGGPQEYTITVHPNGYDTENSVYRAWVSGYGASRANQPADSATEARANLVTGANAETKIYWKFNLSSIPVGATIVSVEAVIKARISNTSEAIASRYLVACEGTTEVGTHKTVGSTATQHTIDCGSGWTRDKLQNFTILFYAKRGTGNTTTNYFEGVYGADLTVTYSV